MQSGGVCLDPNSLFSDMALGSKRQAHGVSPARQTQWVLVLPMRLLGQSCEP